MKRKIMTLTDRTLVCCSTSIDEVSRWRLEYMSITSRVLAVIRDSISSQCLDEKTHCAECANHENCGPYECRIEVVSVARGDEHAECGTR
jgi:hypothetical protein